VAAEKKAWEDARHEVRLVDESVAEEKLGMASGLWGQDLQLFDAVRFGGFAKCMLGDHVYRCTSADYRKQRTRLAVVDDDDSCVVLRQFRVSKKFTTMTTRCVRINVGVEHHHSSRMLSG
jgi:hypothetical protein